MGVDINDRVSNLEKVLERYIEHSQKTLDSLSREMKEFKNDIHKDTEKFKIEVRRDTEKFKNELRKDTEKFRNEIRMDTEKFKNEIRMDTERFRNEIRKDTEKFKNEVRKDTERFKEEMRNDRREMNRQWGNLANKMGTLVEDIFIPGVKETVVKYFDAEIRSFGIRISRINRETGEEGEFDVVAVADPYVFLVEVKSTPDRRDIDRLIKTIVPRFRRLFPEYEEGTMIPILGSLSFSPEMIPYASQAGVYLLGYREWDYLDFLNFDEIALPQ